ncbi:GAF domain-containing protein [Streptomyces sp. NPDC006475]|uniref:GAF domain-containing protein n=1 Tax=Streptomyces achmelvichensis TaxID=3134111 RepID=A0ACC6Q4J7_9ACTN|nr:MULTISPECIES: GAF domain-containing protein [unclassified Streptomyces]WNO71169.1 GAF domain-containing protein [Streptomyces sp. AM8-1-1]WST41263.1 GAF domain-containing protein [Streptomyces sp. NBC_01167]
MSAPVPYTQYDPTGQMLVTPEDRDAPARVARLRELGIGSAPVPEFDAFARNLARTLEAPYAMVNFIDENRQYFAGLYTPADSQPGVELEPQQASTSRVMARDHGWCPHVVVRRKALVLEDVCDYPRFAGNPVVDEIGIRSYLGAPLIDWNTGMALGTICVIDTDTRPWGRQGLETIKSMAQQMVERLHQIEERGQA